MPNNTFLPRKITYFCSKRTGVVLQRTIYRGIYNCKLCNRKVSVSWETAQHHDINMICGACFRAHQEIAKNLPPEIFSKIAQDSQKESEVLAAKKLMRIRNKREKSQLIAATSDFLKGLSQRELINFIFDNVSPETLKKVTS